MAKVTIKMQRGRIDEYKKIIDNIRKRYKNKRMPEYQSGYIAGLEGRIVEMEQWIEAQKGREELVTEDAKTYWNIWGGWSGNHDRRIEDATCSNCGYRHETVFGSTGKLAKNCPRCNRIMSVCET